MSADGKGCVSPRGAGLKKSLFRLFALALCTALCFALLPVPALAAGGDLYVLGGGGGGGGSGINMMFTPCGGGGGGAGGYVGTAAATGNGGNGGAGGNATFGAASLSAASVSVTSGVTKPNSNQQTAAGGVAGLQVAGTLSAPVLNFTRTLGGGALDVDAGTLDVSAGTTITVDRTTAGDVVIGTAGVASGQTLAVVPQNGGKLTINNLEVAPDGIVDVPDAATITTTLPAVTAISPSGAGAPVQAAALALTFNQKVAAVPGGTVTITVDGTTYTYTIPASPSIVGGTGLAAAIPLESFMSGAYPLVLGSGKTYEVGVSAGAFRIPGIFTNGVVFGNTANAGVGSFDTDASTATAVTGLTPGPAALPAAGGSSTITAAGTNLPGGVRLAAFDGATMLGGAKVITPGAAGGTASFTFPANASATAAKTYTVKASLDGGRTWLAGPTAAVTVAVAQSVTSVAVTPQTATVVKGRAQQFTANVIVTGGASQAVTWSVAGGTASSIDTNGLLTVGAGETAQTLTVTATAAFDGTKSGAAPVTVAEVPAVPVTGVRLNLNTAGVVAGTTLQLNATVVPEDATLTAVIWTSGDPGIATVDANGLVTGIRPGTATITATTADGGFVATCGVTVTAHAVAVAGVRVNPPSASVVAGNAVRLTAIVVPDAATNKAVTWTSGDPGIATVDGGGLVRGIRAGTATITVTTADGGFTATCVVTVTQGGLFTGDGGGPLLWAVPALLAGGALAGALWNRRRAARTG